MSKDNSTEELRGFILSQGPRESANEHLVPEQLFDDPKTTEKEAQGISAVKALQIAAQQGQTIYTVTKANYAEILPKLNHSTDVMTDVRDAINAGKEVTISQTQVHAFGWSGTGYIVLDPESGVGGYLIGGGADGGFTNWIQNNSTDLGVLLTFISIIALGLAGVGFFAAIMAATSLIAGVIGIVLSAYMLRLRYLEALENANSAKSVECVNLIFGLIAAINLSLGIFALFVHPALAVILMFPLLIYGDSLAEAVGKRCNDVANPVGDGGI